MTPESNVKILLESWPAARYDENLLISSVWSREMEFKHINVNKMHVYLFMGMLMEGKLTAASEILKIRDDIQHAIPELRGEYYQPRPPGTIKDMSDE